MRVSVITVCFNAAANIEETIQSVLSQDYEDVEYIIVDGGSKDGTVAILERYKDKIKYISEKDEGIYDAMNKGVKMATGEIVGMIGADDFYPSNDVISAVVTAFKEQNTDSVYGNKIYVDPENTKKVVRFWEQVPYSKDIWLKGWMPPHLSFYLKKSAYDQYGLYKKEFTCSGDYELMLRMLYKNNLSSYYLPKDLMTMRAGGTSNASLQNRWVANREDRMAWDLNGIKPRWYTLLWKPLSKVTQLFKK